MSISLPTVAITPLRTPVRNMAAALLNPAQVPPRSIMAAFDWVNEYGGSTSNPNVNVLVGMEAGGAQMPVDIIRSVKIDNLGNSFPVYVYFLDTTDTIVAPPNTIVWEPVVTNAKIANVICTGIVNGVRATTKVYFCNFFVPPYVNPEQSQSAPLLIASPNGGGQLGSGVNQLILTTQGAGYTAVPAVTIGAAPVGGVTATASCTCSMVGTPQAVILGSFNKNYVVGEVVPMTNGVSLVCAAVQPVFNPAFGTYFNMPSAYYPVTQSGTVNPVVAAGALPAQVQALAAAGIRANITWGVGSVSLLTTGSGYTLAPPVLFSGAGGAAASAVLAASTGLVTNYGVPALGDLNARVNARFNNTGTDIVSITPNYIYPTAIYINWQLITTTAEQSILITDIAETLIFWQTTFGVLAGNVGVGYNQTGLGFRWSGAGGLRIRAPGVDATGKFTLQLNYSSNPQLR